MRCAASSPIWCDVRCRFPNKRTFDERGAVTAELAVTLPAVAVLVAVLIGAIMSGAAQVRLEHAAAQSARLAARGEETGRVAEVARALAGAEVALSRSGDLVCAQTAVLAPLAIFGRLEARSCALDAGR